MSILKAFGAAAMPIAISFTPAAAQWGQVIQEPGYCAFFYPNANCQNKGPGNPYTDPNYYRNGGQSSGQRSGVQDINGPLRGIARYRLEVLESGQDGRC